MFKKEARRHPVFIWKTIPHLRIDKQERHRAILVWCPYRIQYISPKV